MTFGFFTRKKKLLPDFSFLGCDIHSHVLPGIDDGAQNLEESVGLIRKLGEYGIKDIVCTPHVQSEFYKNTPATIREAYTLVNDEREKGMPGVKLRYAAEYLVDEGFVKINQDDLLTFGQDFILVELSYFSPYPGFFKVIQLLKDRGLRVVLAHPERYSYWYNSPEVLQQLKDSGVYFQVNLISVGGHFGDVVRKQAENLLDAGMIDFAATDIHHNRHFAALEKALYSKSLYRAVENGQIKNSLIEG